MKKILSIIMASMLISLAGAQDINRSRMIIPDIGPYVSLKCDLHMHTVFSDGQVWPDLRVEEAFREGIDAISITDHIEYLPHKDDIKTNFNRPYELAENAARMAGIILIRGAEITRGMPPGHLNAIFLKDASALNKENYLDALKEARKQGAFITWNHPGWEPQAKEGIKWYPEHTKLLEEGLIDGIEIVNYNEFYPEALTWCIEKNLTPMSCSDIHGSLSGFYESNEVSHRPVTIVFAKDRTEASIREGLDNRRTAGWFGDWVIGSEQYLEALAHAALSVQASHFETGQTEFRKLVNNSSFEFFIQYEGKKYHINALSELIIPFSKSGEKSFVLTNFITESGELKFHF